MRLGLMIGSDRERPREERLAGILEDGQRAEEAGFHSFWVPQIPGYHDALTALALLGPLTQRIELGTAVVPVQTRHPVAMAQQALTTDAACSGRLALGLGASHHWIIAEQLGLAYERPAAVVRDYLAVLNAAFAGPGRLEVHNETYAVDSPMDLAAPGPVTVLVAALAPLMLRIAGEQASGTILWMADERTVAEHVVPRLSAAARSVGRADPRVVAGVPVALCPPDEVPAARAYASEVLGHADLSPNYERLLEHGDARDVGDTMAAGDEEAVAGRLRRYGEAGVTDLAARVVPLGEDPAQRLASRRRTEAFLSTLVEEL